MTRRAMVLVGVVFAAAGCGAKDEAKPAAVSVATRDSLATLRARAAADGLGKDLQGRLLQQLEAGGPMAAVAFCADSAQAFTARHARDGVTVRRVSTRTRNPANAPDSLELRALQVFAGLHGTAEPAAEFTEASGEGAARELRYLRPIVIQERCLACHGDPSTMAPEVRKLIAERYPADQATGYAAGDLRGAISVRLPVGE